MGWTTLNSKYIHKNPWYSYREDDVLRPNGTPGKYFVIESNHSVTIIPEEDGYIYLVEQTRYPHGNVLSLEMVIGGVKNGKSLIESAKEELEEEAGLIADELFEIGYCYPYTGMSNERNYVFIARGLKKVKQKCEETEDITVKKIKIEEVLDKILSSQINCGISIAAFFKYILWKEKINK